MQTSDKYLDGSSSLVSKSERVNVCGNEPCVLWLTGLSGSGKSTIARALEKRLWQSSHTAAVLDGDNIRLGINSDLGFSPEDRIENNRRVAEMSKIMSESGLIVISALISPFQESRDKAREIVKGNFFEIYIECSIGSCMERDPKGLYNKVRQGHIKNFTGVSSTYEEPANPDLSVNTDILSVEESVDRIILFLKERSILSE